MQALEIYSLSNWFMSWVGNPKITSLLSQCASQIKANHTKGATAINTSMSAQKSNLYSALEGIDQSVLSENQKKCLNKMGISFLVGRDVTGHFDKLFEMLNYDVNHVLTTLGHYVQYLTSSAQSFTQLSGHLPKVLLDEDLKPIAVPKGKVLTRLTFHNEASISNLVEFNNWAKSWNYIARGVAIAINESPEDFEVVNADRGSLLVDILTTAGAVTVIAKALKSLTELATLVVECKIKLKELNSFKNVVSDETYEKFKEEAALELERQEGALIGRVVDKLKEEGLVKVNHADNELNRAVKEIYKFNSSGGGIFCLSSNDDTFDDNSVLELNQSYARLQEKPELKLIEDKDL